MSKTKGDEAQHFLSALYCNKGEYDWYKGTIRLPVNSMEEATSLQRNLRDWKVFPQILRKKKVFSLYLPRKHAWKMLDILKEHIELEGGMIPDAYFMRKDDIPKGASRAMGNAHKNPREEIIENIRDFMRLFPEYDGFPLVRYLYFPGSYSPKTIERFFGSMLVAVREAGVNPVFI